MNLKLLVVGFLFILTGCSTIGLFESSTTKPITKSPQEIVTPKTNEKKLSPIVVDSPIVHIDDACTQAEECELEMENKTPTHSDVWQRIKSQLHMKVPNKRRVRAQKNWYLKHPEYIQRVTKRAEPYLYYIVEALEQQNLPLELALLPIVESAFDPFAYSHGRASGMWQFIPATGKNFGLTQDWWYDGRRDVYLSTQAAIKYLKHLNTRFKGNWLHALAAYNSGEGNVARAIRKNKRKNKPTDFWSLSLPKETKAYIPKLLALSDILANTTADDKNWIAIPNKAYFARVPTNGQIDISLAAAAADISMDQFYQLNPGYNQWATAPDGPHFILIPIDSVKTFHKNLALIPDNQRISFKRYVVKSGDSLNRIAKKFDTSVQLLKDNNSIKSTLIKKGQVLFIPTASQSPHSYHKSTQQRLLTKQNKKRRGHKIAYIVKPGDSFWTIARKYNVNIKSLAQWNNMAPKDPLQIGQILAIWKKQPEKLASLSSINSRTKKIFYKVRRGESLSKIANKFRVSLNRVKQWNTRTGGQKYLQPGDSLTLYVDITQQF